jgi:UDP-N-acetylglucosamine 1-carboxyvinyltransferase
MLTAALLTAEPVTFTNVPDLNDIGTMLRLLAQMGVKVERQGSSVTLDAAGLDQPVAPYEMVKTMRASILVLDRWWRAWAGESRCRAVARSVRGRLTSTSRA